MKRRGMASGLILGVVIGVAVSAGVSDAYTALFSQAYGGLDHNGRALYLRGMADGLVGAALASGLTSLAGGDSAQLLLKISGCMSDHSTDTVIGVLGNGAVQAEKETGVAVSAVIALMQFCR